MSDRKNLKIAPDTYEHLKENKPQGVSWDNLFADMLRGYEDPRPLFPKFRRDDDGSKQLGADNAVLDRDERAEIATRAKELQAEINFKKILRDSNDVTEAKAALLRELLTHQDLSSTVVSEGSVSSSVDIPSTPVDTIAERTADRVVEKLEGDGDE